jgi:hypothetical protein
MVSFQDLFFKSKGKPIVYQNKQLVMVDTLELPDYIFFIKVSFIKTQSDWKQGIVIKSNGDFEINHAIFKSSIVLWEDVISEFIDIKVSSKDKKVLIYNVWDTGDGVMHYWHNGGAMYIKNEPENKTRYYFCNDGVADDDLDDLVFKIIW